MSREVSASSIRSTVSAASTASCPTASRHSRPALAGSVLNTIDASAQLQLQI